MDLILAYGPLSAGVVSVLAYSLMQLLFKRSGSAAANPLVLTAWLGLMAPIWLLLLGLGLPTGLLFAEHSVTYWAYTGSWAALSVITMFLMIAVLQRISLTEFTAYRKALVTLGVLLADVLVFNEQFSSLALVCIGGIVVASMALTYQAGEYAAAQEALLLAGAKGRRKKPVTSHHLRPSVLSTLGLMLLLAAALSLQMLVYKRGLQLQPDLISHVFLAKGLAALLSLALFAIPHVRRAPRPATLPMIAAIIACFFVGSVFEAAAIKHLPLTLLVILSMVAAAVFAVHDIYRRDLPCTATTLGLITFIFTGFGLLAYLG